MHLNSISIKKETIYSFRVQPSLCPTSTQSLSSVTFDPFASFQTSTNELNMFMTQTQPQQQFNKSFSVNLEIAKNKE